ncbi:MAG TPA: YgiT-type zinc finger domain-containing protein [Nitrospiraceae bacterium]|jgi:YgiT-type zinc finger domain-containing protein|nr:YgiT-type zinc finger domain-containing protein [Nitrospiraceae bacterium]
MTGEQEKQKNKKCPLCGGELHDGITNAPFFEGEKIVVIKEVPAEICSECGESYVKSSVVDGIERLLDKIEDIDSEMSVVHYKAA